MTLSNIVRLVAAAIAVIGIVDPSWTLRRRAPVAVELRGDDASAAAEVRGQLESRLGDAVTFDSSREPAALVLVGSNRIQTERLGADMPVSTVARAVAGSPNVRIVDARDPAPGRVGWAASVEASIEGRGVAGQTSAVILESRGAELSRITHKWTSDSERFNASLRYTPAMEGASTVTLRVSPLEGETTDSDNAVDLRTTASGGRLKILVHETRPSWNATFVRRALEEDPTFDVSAFVHASKGLAVRAGAPPPALTGDALSPFDAVVIGAPEELRASELEALRTFARRRGGAVVLLPDRRPAGRYLELMPPVQFDEILVNDPVAIRAVAGNGLRASEIALSRGSDTAWATALATFEQNKIPRAVVLEWLSGEGRVIFSGALDAWRYRGDTDEGFSRFWRARIAEAAQAAPARLSVSFTPGVPAPRDEVTIRARLRLSELETSGESVRVPGVNARLVDRTGHVRPVRLWPASQPGTFEGRVTFAQTGSYDLQVTSDGGLVVDDVIDVAASVRRPAPSAESTAESLRLIAAATGGVAVDSDLNPLERHLRGLSSGQVDRVLHPWRSTWMLLTFVALVSFEWATRRRQGRP